MSNQFTGARAPRDRVHDFAPKGANDSGLCMCGCGEVTKIARLTDHRRGDVRGHHRRFVRGHQRRLAGPAYVEVDMGYTTPCHVNVRLHKATGYGLVWVAGRDQKAHVIAWVAVNGPVPEGLELDHLCRVKACRNPDHLEPVTHAVNCQRSPKATITPEDVQRVRALLGTMPKRDISRLTGISYNIVNEIARGRSWANVQ